MKLTDIIKNYVEQPDTDFAILINGQWGSGKTYFLKNDISKVINSIKYEEAGKESKNYELIYVSLYGITTADELQKKLFLELNPKLKTKVGTITSMLIIKGLSKIGFPTDSDDLKDLQSIFGGIPKYKILAFDDLERLETDTLNEVLGFINSYTEHQNIKVIIVADEEKIQKKLPDYKSIKEKLIRFTYLYNPDLKDVFPSFVDRYHAKEYKVFLTERTQIICNLFDKGVHKNLRSLRFVLDLFEQIFDALFKDAGIDPSIRNIILDRFLFFFITYSIAFKKGAGEAELNSLNDLSSEIDFVFNRIFFDLLGENTEGEQEQIHDGIEKFKKDFEKAFVDNTKNEFQYFPFLTNYIHMGDLSLTDLISVSMEIQQKVKDREQKPEQIALDKLKSCLELNDDEFSPLIEEIYCYVKEGAYKLEIYPTLFQNILNCSINGIDNLNVDNKTVEFFKEGMKESLRISKYKQGLNNNIYIQEPKKEMVNEIRKYSEELNDSLLISNDEEIANKVFNLFKEENFQELSDFLLSEDVQSNPIFQEEFINPSDFLTKFNELTNLKKTKTLDLLQGFSRRFTNYGGGLKKEFPFFSNLLALVEHEIKKWKGNFHLSTQILIQLQGILTPIVDRLKKIGEGTYY